MCLRNVFGGKTNPHLPLAELTLADCQRIFPPEFLTQLRRIYLCGNYGDPLMARETLEILEYFRSVQPEIELELFTNGSARGREWWSRLARTVDRCRFGIDGLADTNHIYRRGTHWETIYVNLTAFLEAGGRAEWDFIVFRHNEHQVEEARALAQRLGVHKFNVKKTGRFFSNSQAAVKDRQEVHNRAGELEYHLELPRTPKYVNSALQREDEIVHEFGSLKKFFAQTPISCKVARERSIYISAEGYVFPCCWTANQLYPWYYEKRGAPIWKMIDALPGGLDSLNAKRHPVRDIVSGEFFQRRLPDSWDKTSFAEGRLFVCGKTCGQGFDAFKAQFERMENPAPKPAHPSAPPSPGTPF
jgi:MoaA/NifB/PqqE/SkfB family radical SAM enzyme